MPYLYQTVVKHWKRKLDERPEHACLTVGPSSFEVAFAKFRAYFKNKTGISWDERLTDVQVVAPHPFKYRCPVGPPPLPSRFLVERS